MKSLEQVDRWLGRHLERWSANLAGGAHPKEALEIRREILAVVNDKVEARGNGEYLFPYSEITVALAAHDPAQEATFDAAFREEDALQTQVREMLAEAGCRADTVSVLVEIRPTTADEPPFDVRFKRVEKTTKGAAATPAKTRPAAWLYVVKGSAERPEYFIGKDLVHLGRLKEVSTKSGGLRRRNDVAFDDSETTVSRDHAHIEFEEGKFRLFQDGGEVTSLVRDGRVLALPPAGARGTQLRGGDEIHLGEARLRFEVGE